MKMTTFAGVLCALLIVGACAAFGGFADLPHLASHVPVSHETVMAMGMMLPGLPQGKPRGIMSVRAEMPVDVKAAIDAVNRAFETFKATHSDKEKELLKKFDDVVTTEKLERVNSSIGDMQAAIDQANTKLAALAVGAGGDVKIRDQEYTDAFSAHFRKGDVQAALNKGADAEGGYLAPIEWDRTITSELIQISPMRQLAQVQTISGAGFIRLLADRGTGSGWVGETAGRPQTSTSKFTPLRFTPGEIYANPAATQQMLDDAEINLEQWLANEVETEFSYQEGIAYAAGDGTNKPRGFLTYIDGGASDDHHPWGNIPVLDAAAADEITADEILDVIYDLPSEYTQNARFTMNRSTQGKIRKLKDGNDNYLWQPSATAGQPSSLFGYPLTEMAAMPDVATGAIPIAFGDFRRGYLIVDRVGVRVLRDPYTNKPYVHFYTTKRVGGGVQDPTVLRLLKMG